MSPSDQAPFPCDELRTRAAAFAEVGVYVGTSSWKYEGWLGQLYTSIRYERNRRWSKKRFEDKCLTEYAAVLCTVSVDATFYQFPSPALLEKLAGQVPENFRFGFKATGEVTIRTFPKLPQHGDRAGERNDHFLNADLFAERFLAPLAPHREKVGLVMFEFSRFHEGDFARGREFVEGLDGFLGKLPREFAYAVEIRNKSLLHPEYFAALRKHGVAHVFNSWTHMPPVGEQMAIEGAWTADFAAARFLLTPGRSYEEAVTAFAPYRSVKTPDPVARAAGKALIRKVSGEPSFAPAPLRADASTGQTAPNATEGRQEAGNRRKRRPSFVFVNNRLEGNALQTLLAMTEEG